MFYALLKWILILGLLASGALFLATGLGVEIPLVKYKGLEAHNVPVGIALLTAAVVLAVFWKISITQANEESFSETSSDGGSTSGRSSSKTTITFGPPRL